ncbi:MAG: caspase family protein [Myxococcota bacterium]
MIWIASALAGVVDVAPPPERPARRVAVLVGVQEYGDPALQGLRFAAKDARDLGRVLGAPDLGGFDEVVVLTEAAATSRAALRAKLRDVASELGPDDTFLVYASGHGTLTLDPVDGSRLWFLPSDATLDRPVETGIAVAELEALVDEAPARRRVLVLDTCHNGRAGSKSSLASATAGQLAGLRGEPPAPRVDRVVSESEARLYAAQYHQPAMEDPKLQNGVYTHYLIEGLTAQRVAADLDRDGLVDVAEAHEYARDHTITWTGGLQVPRAEYRIVGREDIFLSGKADARDRAEAALLYACDVVLARARLFVDGVPRGELPGLYAVEPGVSRIEVRDAEGRTLLRQNVSLEAGESLPVEDLLRGRRSAVTVLAGASWLGGAEGFHPVAPSFQVAWSPAVAGRLRPDVHVGADLANGPMADSEGYDVTTGSVSAGATLGVPFGIAWIGPTVDARLALRAATDVVQEQIGGAGGVSAGVSVPVAAHVRVDARADAWVSAQRWEGDWAPVGGVALRVGAAFLP